MGEKLKIEYVSIDSIMPYARNAKLHPQQQIEQIKRSIEDYGMNDPIGVWHDEIVEGHGRLMACKELGITEVPIIRLEHMSDEQRKEYMLVHNQTTMNSDFDLDTLSEELDSLLDFDAEFYDFDISFDEEEPQEIVEDDAPEPPTEPITKLGDLWQLGSHRLICGDSTDVAVIDRLMDGVKADMVFTDPPYGMKKESEGVLNDNLNYDDLLDFNRQWIPLTFGALKDTGCWYCWGIDEPLMDIYSNILKPMKKENQIVIRNYITWAKHSAFGIGSDLQLSYPKETEKCWFVMKGMDWNNNNAEFFNSKFERVLDYMQGEAQKAKIQPKDIQKVCGVQMYSHWFTKSQFCILSREHYQELQRAYNGCFLKPYDDLRKMLGDSNNPTADLKPYFDSKAIDSVGDIGLTDVWRFPITSNKERAGLGHATPKPIALCSRAIHASSREGEIVLDCFGGSGSTLIACEQLNRKCYMAELDPKYVSVILQRYINLKGSDEDVFLLEDGKKIPYSDLARWNND